MRLKHITRSWTILVSGAFPNPSRAWKYKISKDLLVCAAIAFRSTTPPKRGWQSMHWSDVIKNYVRNYKFKF
jgi:hypothetical protein